MHNLKLVAVPYDTSGKSIYFDSFEDYEHEFNGTKYTIENPNGY